MKTLRRPTLVASAVAFAVLLVMALSVSAASKVYLNRGEISGIDLTYETVVVEVPVDGQLMTVGGPLAENAELKKNGQTVDLEDFKVGETVTVKWRYTEEGHRILGLYRQ